MKASNKLKEDTHVNDWILRVKSTGKPSGDTKSPSVHYKMNPSLDLAQNHLFIPVHN